MQKATRHARHYVGLESEINLGKSPSYGVKTTDKGVGSENMSGKLQYGTAEYRTKAQQEVDEAIAIRQALRDKKVKRGKDRTRKKISAIKRSYKLGQLTAEERDAAINKVILKQINIETQHGNH